MAVMEVVALSGFAIDVDELEKQARTEQIQRVELVNEDTRANIYFDFVSFP